MKKKLTLTALFTTMLILLTTTGVYANYQSIPTGTTQTNTASALSQSATTWITGIRQMESSKQVMGLTEEINETTAEATTDSNNIDVHMIKNTEYGAVVILGASEYGKQGEDEARYMNKGSTTLTSTDPQASTTGNVYGVYEMGYVHMSNTIGFEWVAGGSNGFYGSVVSRYINIYVTDGAPSALAGDATNETLGWHDSSGSWPNWRYPGMVRGSSGAFQFGGDAASYAYPSRGVAVCGAGV